MEDEHKSHESTTRLSGQFSSSFDEVGPLQLIRPQVPITIFGPEVLCRLFLPLARDYVSCRLSRLQLCRSRLGIRNDYAYIEEYSEDVDYGLLYYQANLVSTSHLTSPPATMIALPHINSSAILRRIALAVDLSMKQVM